VDVVNLLEELCIFTITYLTCLHTSEDGGICSALNYHYLVDEVDYRDELVDTWMLWLRDGKPPGSLNADRLSSCRTSRP
jgi:hypothetical protein